MKKGFKIFMALFATLALAGCSNNGGINIKLEENKDIVKDGDNVVLTKQDIYDYIRKTNPEAINKTFLNHVIEKVLKTDSSFAGENFIESYEKEIKRYFRNNFIENDEYKIDGEFSEELLVDTLRSELNKIDGPDINPNFVPVTEGPTFDLGLTYDYSSYIKDNLNNDVYLNMLKEDYLLNVDTKALDNSKTRIITIYKADNFEDMKEVVNDLFTNKYESLEALEEVKKNEEKKEIARQYCENLGIKPENSYGYESENCTPTPSSYDTSYNKFTTCANGRRCTTQEGFKYQIQLIDEKEYIKEQTINRKSTEVLYPQIFNHIMRENVNDYLISDEKMKTIFGENHTVKGNFIINDIFKDNPEELFTNNDIILSDGSDPSCYIALVREVNSNTLDLSDKQEAASLLIEKVSEGKVLLHYMDSLKVELIDQQLIDSYGELIKKSK